VHALGMFRLPLRLRPAPVFLIAMILAGVFVTARLTADAPTSVDLSRYVRVGRFDLPEPTRTTPPADSLLAQEVSAVTYNWDTDTLFVVGDGGTSVVQVGKDGHLLDSMTLAPGPSPQGTDFYDTEGLTYVGGGEFVLVEERYRQANVFTYVAGGTLHKSDVLTVQLGTTVGNVGLEGVSYDPLTSGFVFVKEKDPQSIFQTGIDFLAGTATNGSSSTTSSTNLFNPALASLADFSDVFALSNLPFLSGQADFDHLLVISQESGQIVNIDRAGTVYSRLTIVADPGSPLSVPDMTMEGVTMDRDGFLYVVNENGGGDANHPQLWVYAHSTAPNLAPTAVVLNNPVTSIPENTSTAAPVKVAEIIVIDDGLGANNLSVSGADASFFQIVGTGLFLNAGTALNSITRPSYSVTVNVDDPTAGSTPDASVGFDLTVTAATGGTPSLIISEVAPWSSGNSPASLAVDWFEVTNIGTAAADISGWKMDDSGPTLGTAVALHGITSIAPGASVIFMETTDAALATKKAAFLNLWFGANPPPNLQVGNYSGSGVGLSTGGDAVNLFDTTPAPGTIRAGVTFGANGPVPPGPFKTFDNAAALNNTTISTLSAVGVSGAFAAFSDPTEIGSPGTIGAPPTPVVTIAATDASATEAGSEPGAFRITRTGSTVGALTVNYTIAAGSGQATPADYTPALTGAVTIASGQSSANLTIAPVDDGSFERSETVTLTLFDSGSYDTGTPSTATVTIVDNDPPDTSIDSSPADPTNSTDAHFAFSLGNPGSGVVVFECSLDGGPFVPCSSLATYSNLADGSHTFLVRAVDADNSANVDPTPASFTWTVDSTAPTIAGARAPAANSAGWNNTDVTVTFTCSDAGGSGVRSCGATPQVVSTEGAGQSRTGTAIDNAFNTASATVGGISIDKTAPVVTPPPNQTAPQTVPAGALVTYPAAAVLETGSGLASSACLPASGSVFPVGVTTVTCRATDVAGNTGSGTFTVKVNPAPDGRMYGVGHVDTGRTGRSYFVFRVAQLRNLDYGRLEFWSVTGNQCRNDDDDEHDGNITGEHDGDFGRRHCRSVNTFEAASIPVVVFLDDPAFRSGRGRPAVDTVRFVGTGRWNGRVGYTFEATATDKGEPGRNRDTFTIVVKDAHGDVVADAGGELDGGNIQSTRLHW
jgi:uncharacterized protein YjiK